MRACNERKGWQGTLHYGYCLFCINLSKIHGAMRADHSGQSSPGDTQMKILVWIIAIIFLIGLLVVTGVLKLIF